MSSKEWYALHVKTGSEEDVALDVYGIGDADSLLPVYLRLSQAERERNERLAKEANN